MIPTALPAIRHVGQNSLRWRRQRAMALFLLAYVGTWSAVGLALLPHQARLGNLLWMLTR
jgi:hypothetical protein